MTEDKIIELARQADPFGEHGRLFFIASVTPYILLKFAELVATEEREACAAICDEHADNPVYCGEAIRARGDL